jgi:hypothetical protein
MRGKRIARLIIVVLAGVALGGILTLILQRIQRASNLPPPPTIDVERGALPGGVVAFEERISAGQSFVVGGSGFLLELPNGDVIGVTAAHSTGNASPDHIVFARAGETQPVATFENDYAPRGQARTGADMTIDYALFQLHDGVDPSVVLRPDPRGGPQAGERVLLYSGLGDGSGGQRMLAGTVESVDARGAWVRMDDVFNPALMSGSPMISQHTGRVVGMVIAMSLNNGGISIAIHPIGSILAKAKTK